VKIEAKKRNRCHSSQEDICHNDKQLCFYCRSAKQGNPVGIEMVINRLVFEPLDLGAHILHRDRILHFL
jgi:hypothetical protein